ncbi:MAG: hypothetical protein HQL56_13505 [Magnetococcales bacterium]|nr:hypothetical protein [Magnetococcales bacterium]
MACPVRPSTICGDCSVLLSGQVSLSEGDVFWTGLLELDDPASYQLVRVGGLITLSVGGAVFALLVDNKTLQRDGVGMPRFSVSVISPTARFSTPRATPIERTWATPIQARAAAEEVIGQEIDWGIVDWLIPGGRLAVHNAAPIEVVRTIAEAAGGVVETLPGGGLRVRHRFPVRVPDWATATPDHVLTDAADNLSCRESHMLRHRVNRVLVRGYLPQAGYIAAEVDSRPDGLNQGRDGFLSGETAHLLIHAGPDLTGVALTSSAGVLLPGAPQTIQATQDIVFDGVATGSLDKPAISIASVIWLGNDLGTLTLEADRRTLSAERSGVAIARIQYTTLATSWSLTAPESVAGLDDYPVQVRATALSGGTPLDGEIVCQRGAGDHPGEDISDPLLADTLAKLSRGRAEIDAGESLQEVSLVCVYRSVLPGHLVEIHDALMGQSWRGKVTSVSHHFEGVKATTSLEIVRYVPTTT